MAEQNFLAMEVTGLHGEADASFGGARAAADEVPGSGSCFGDMDGQC